MKTNYIWKTQRDELNRGDLYAGATNNPGFKQGQRWAHYARKTPYGETYASNIYVFHQIKYGYSHETVSENEQIEINTCRKVAADLNSVGIKCECFKCPKPKQSSHGCL